MTDLDDATRRALLQRIGPPRGSRERVLLGLRNSLGPPGGGGAQEGPGSAGQGPGGLSGGELAGASQAAWAAKIIAVTVGLSAAGLVAMATGGAAIRSLQEESRATPPGVTRDASPEAEPISPTPPAAHAPPRPVIEPKTSTPTGLPRPPTSGLARAQAPEPLSAPEAGLEAEMALLHAAKREQDPATALAHLDHHAARFPSGELAREREALRVELLCKLGEGHRARAARQRFVSTYPDSPLHPRACDA